MNRKLSELRNYWRYLQSHEVVAEDRLPVRSPSRQRPTSPQENEGGPPATVPSRGHRAAMARRRTARRPQPIVCIRIAAYSGARLEGPCELKTTDIRVDPDTGISFMRMCDKTEAGDRFVPIHPEITTLIRKLVKDADTNGGYLLHINAHNKYHERGALIGKRFGILKSKHGFDTRFVFHSIRKTVANMFENAECPEGVAADVVGHVKPTMTYGLYSGITKMDLRASWMARAICYPASSSAMGSNGD